MPIPPTFTAPTASPNASPTNPPGQNAQLVLTFDPEWLAITRAFNPHMSVVSKQSAYPDEAHARGAISEALEWVKKNVYGVSQSELVEKSPLEGLVKTVESCQKFCVTAPGPGQGTGPENRQRTYRSPSFDWQNFDDQFGFFL